MEVDMAALVGMLMNNLELVSMVFSSFALGTTLLLWVKLMLHHTLVWLYMLYYFISNFLSLLLSCNQMGLLNSGSSRCNTTIKLNEAKVSVHSFVAFAPLIIRL